METIRINWIPKANDSTPQRLCEEHNLSCVCCETNAYHVTGNEVDINTFFHRVDALGLLDWSRQYD